MQILSPGRVMDGTSKNSRIKGHPFVTHELLLQPMPSTRRRGIFGATRTKDWGVKFNPQGSNQQKQLWKKRDIHDVARDVDSQQALTSNFDVSFGSARNHSGSCPSKSSWSFWRQKWSRTLRCGSSEKPAIRASRPRKIRGHIVFQSPLHSCNKWTNRESLRIFLDYSTSQVLSTADLLVSVSCNAADILWFTIALL